jgi:hypothetical protein
MMMTRRLVQYNEAARHPLRRSLPPLTLGQTIAAPPPKSWWRKEDTHLFMLSFTAFFVAITGFIA